MHLDRTIDNRTAMQVRAFLLHDRHGREVVAAIAKLTWCVSPRGEARVSSAQRPIRIESEPWEPGPWASLKYPSDVCEEKPGTDVVLVGHAQPSAERPTTELEVSLLVANGKRSLRKVVRVFGSRVFMEGVLGIRPGPAATLGKTPLRYELAEGGVDLDDATQPLVDRRNPSGVGVARARNKLLGTAAYRLEPVGGRAPAGFGAIAAGWSPRAELAGTYDESWARRRAPLKPRDFDPRHHAVAHPDLHSDAPLSGTEAIEALGVTASGAWRFALPPSAPCFEAELYGKRETLPTHLDTFLVDADEGVVELVWRAAVPLPRRSTALGTIVVREAEPLAAELWERGCADLHHHESHGACHAR